MRPASGCETANADWLKDGCLKAQESAKGEFMSSSSSAATCQGHCLITHSDFLCDRLDTFTSLSLGAKLDMIACRRLPGSIRVPWRREDEQQSIKGAECASQDDFVKEHQQSRDPSRASSKTNHQLRQHDCTPEINHRWMPLWVYSI